MKAESAKGSAALGSEITGLNIAPEMFLHVFQFILCWAEKRNVQKRGSSCGQHPVLVFNVIDT
jgi:hypothetical protein